MSQSLRPGTTVPPPQTIISVAALRDRMTSLSEPAATKRPSFMATVEANEPRPSCVAMRPFETIMSARRVSRLSPLDDSPHPANAYDRPKAPADLKKSLRVGFLLITTSRLKTVRSEEHTSELQSLSHIVCRLL